MFEKTHEFIFSFTVVIASRFYATSTCTTEHKGTTVHHVIRPPQQYIGRRDCLVGGEMSNECQDNSPTEG